MEISEVPIPACGDNGVLVQTTFSLISAGTEKTTVSIAQKSLLGKAKARPELVKLAIEKIKTEGFLSTLNKIVNKPEVLTSLGYSCAGRVLMTGKNINGIHVGDRVACAGGGFATHAEINYIPKNLLVKIPDGVSAEEAAYTTVGAIAMQGIRQLGPVLGEKIAVIGSGLIGSITVQLLKANGCKVLVADIDPVKLEYARKSGADQVCESADLQMAAQAFSGGYGMDGVMITASSSSNQIITDAGIISRKKGRVVMVGQTPIDIPRDIYYQKELDFRLSMSYGPGRYDPSYEIHGIDYPYHYVRWTEQRNMEAFLTLISERKLDVKSLTTHRFTIDNALDAYNLILGKSGEPYLGVIVSYHGQPSQKSQVTIDAAPRKTESKLKIGLIGAGNFAQHIILPNLRKAKCEFVTLVNTTPAKSLSVGKNFGFQHISSRIEDVIENENINAVIIATPHNTHAEIVIKALQSRKHIFVEKPLAISEEHLLAVKKAYQNSDTHLMVGFNRRFSPHARVIRESIQKSYTPLVMNYIVNAGPIDLNHWTQDPDIGGGRIIGEACHFIDFMQFISDSKPVSVFAVSLKSDNKNFANNDSIQATIKFENGSIGNITYHAVGDTSQPKEYFEVAGGGLTIKMFDYTRTLVSFKNKVTEFKTKEQDKGFVQEFTHFAKAILESVAAPVPFESYFLTTLTTFRILESIQTGQYLQIDSEP